MNSVCMLLPHSFCFMYLHVHISRKVHQNEDSLISVWLIRGLEELPPLLVAHLAPQPDPELIQLQVSACTCITFLHMNFGNSLNEMIFINFHVCLSTYMYCVHIGCYFLYVFIGVL